MSHYFCSNSVPGWVKKEADETVEEFKKKFHLIKSRMDEDEALDIVLDELYALAWDRAVDYTLDEKLL